MGQWNVNDQKLHFLFQSNFLCVIAVSIVNMASPGLDQLFDPPRHGVNKLFTQIPHFFLTMSSIQKPSDDFRFCAKSKLSEASFQKSPQIFDGVKVGRIPRPLDQDDVGPLLEPLGHNLGLVAGIYGNYQKSKLGSWVHVNATV